MTKHERLSFDFRFFGALGPGQGEYANRMFYTSTLILTLLINNAISNVAFDKSLKSFSSNELSPNPTKFNSYDNGKITPLKFLVRIILYPYVQYSAITYLFIIIFPDEPSVSADLSNTEVGTNSDASEDYSESEFKKLQKFQEDEDIDLKSKILFKLLDEGTDEAPMPVVYVEHLKEDAMQSLPSGQASKRSGRYYRRYPWKRQNTRYRA